MAPGSNRLRARCCVRATTRFGSWAWRTVREISLDVPHEQFNAWQTQSPTNTSSRPLRDAYVPIAGDAVFPSLTCSSPSVVPIFKVCKSASDSHRFAVVMSRTRRHRQIPAFCSLAGPDCPGGRCLSSLIAEDGVCWAASAAGIYTSTLFGPRVQRHSRCQSSRSQTQVTD